MLRRFALALCSCLVFACSGGSQRFVTLMAPGVVNDPANKSLRFALLKFGLDTFCKEMLARGIPLKMNDDEPVMGRFYAASCTSQTLDEDARKSFVVQYTGTGFATSPEGGRVAFTSQGLVEYAPDFLLKDGALYVYFRPKVVDAHAFQTLLVESQLAQVLLTLFKIDADAFGRKVTDGELRRGLTVIRTNDAGETDFGVGIIPLGQRPYHPFETVSTDKQTLANERSEVHVGQQDFLGPFSVEDDGRAFYLTLKVDGAAAVDALLVPEAVGKAMLDRYLHQPGPAPLEESAALLDEPVPQGAVWKRYALAPRGRYYLVLDNSAAAGRTSPAPGPNAGHSARVDALLLLGDRP